MDLRNGEYGTLDEILKLTKENNEILHSMRRTQRWASIMRGIYWLIIIGVSVGAYYYVQPYVDGMLSMYKQNSSAFQDLKDFSSKFSDSSQIQSIIDQFNQIKSSK